jgi:hypothetical protein
MPSDKLKFFFVSQVFYPDEISTSSLFTDLAIEIAADSGIEAEGISKSGYLAYLL